jgi:hypothetical protein
MGALHGFGQGFHVRPDSMPLSRCRLVAMKMTQSSVGIILALACAVCTEARGGTNIRPGALHQSSSPAKASADSTNIPMGTEIVGVLSTKLDTKHSKVGDPVEVEVTQDALEGGRAVLKKGSHVTGHITDVNPYSKKVSNARLEIVFDRILEKNGGPVSTYLAINALAAKHDDTSGDIQDPRGLNATATTAGVRGGLGGPPGGTLKPDSKGLFQIDGMSLLPMARDNPPTSLVHSQSRDIHLDRGTEIVLVVVPNNPSPDRSPR